MAFAILSGEIAALSPARNAARTSEILEMLAQVTEDITPIIGSYKGKTEKSFLVQLADREAYSQLREAAHAMNQESILLVDEHGAARLVFLDGEVIEIGQWTYAGMTQPQSDNWSLVAGMYFHTVPAPLQLPYGGYDDI